MIMVPIGCVENAIEPSKKITISPLQGTTPLAFFGASVLFNKGILMDGKAIRQIIVDFIQRTSSPSFFTNTLNTYSQMFPNEDEKTIRAMVVEDINRELEELKKQISSFLSGDNV